jgi:hypothetical protein
MGLSSPCGVFAVAVILYDYLTMILSQFVVSGAQLSLLFES